MTLYGTPDNPGPEVLLSRKINMPDIRKLATWAARSAENMDRLWALSHSDDRRTGLNALWVMTHLPASASSWLDSLKDRLTDSLLSETDTTKKRMLQQLLREREYDAGSIRTDFLDFCFSKINSECEPYAVRCFCIYCAFKMCRHYPELTQELESHLDMLSLQALSPGLKSALRQTREKIARIERRQQT